LRLCPSAGAGGGDGHFGKRRRLLGADAHGDREKVVYARARVLGRRTRAWVCAHATRACVYDAHWVDKDDQGEDTAR
jgi:hypothetical protein